VRASFWPLSICSKSKKSKSHLVFRSTPSDIATERGHLHDYRFRSCPWWAPTHSGHQNCSVST
jgi:hypothetical protein